MRIETRRRGTATRQPGEDQRRETLVRDSAVSAAAVEKLHDAADMDDEIGAAAPRPLDQPVAVQRRADQLNGIGYDRRLENEDVAQERVRDLSSVQLRRTDLNVDRWLQLLDQRR